MDSNILDLHGNLVIQRSGMSFISTTPDFWNTFKILLLVIIWIHLYLTMDTTWSYIFLVKLMLICYVG